MGIRWNWINSKAWWEEKSQTKWLRKKKTVLRRHTGKLRIKISWLWQRTYSNRLVFLFSPRSCPGDSLIPTQFSCVTRLCFSISCSLTYFISIQLNTACFFFPTIPFSPWPWDAPQAPDCPKQPVFFLCWVTNNIFPDLLVIEGAGQLPPHTGSWRGPRVGGMRGQKAGRWGKRKKDQGKNREMTGESKMRGKQDGRNEKNKKIKVEKLLIQEMKEGK